MKLSIDPLYQHDSTWKDKKLGTSGETIGSAGCNLCCHAMLLTYYKHLYNPDSLNELYKSSGVYQNGNLINFWKIPEVFSDIKADQFIQCPDVPAPLDLIDQYLNDKKPVIAMIDFLPATKEIDTHFILIIGRSED